MTEEKYIPPVEVRLATFHYWMSRRDAHRAEEAKRREEELRRFREELYEDIDGRLNEAAQALGPRFYTAWCAQEQAQSEHQLELDRITNPEMDEACKRIEAASELAQVVGHDPAPQ
jgi:hypothetical protein